MEEVRKNLICVCMLLKIVLDEKTTVEDIKLALLEKEKEIRKEVIIQLLLEYSKKYQKLGPLD